MKKILFIMIALLITAGCASSPSSSENSSEENTTEDDVTKVLEQIFSGPDEELEQLHEEENYQGISSYYMDQFEPYFTEKYMKQALDTNLLNSFHQKAGNDVNMEIGKMSVEQSEETETAYDFDMQINISNGETADVSGRVNTNEEGKITRIYYNDDVQSLLHAFDTAVQTEEGLFEYDRSRLVSRTGDEAYQPKYPTLMPFEVDGVEIDPGVMEEKDTVLTFIFHAEMNEEMELTTVKDGDISYDDIETEEVSIGDQTGQYAGNEGETQRLIWKDGSIMYELKGNVDGLSKDDLIMVAESFE
ncbi:DUF4367 domain-containing protein [Halobacillus sp. Nhm2S1]|uniref:DUF4367 domain-containing protein n=1 Tax=Halobacillus sp. Nhm2S1 TaxID=2866716 RepID=UPI001C731C4D|nr:DUF4367 domain-containing protein [Halobacillus sp. Nhm2S1]MBX0356106.1 DUF4367 domain-containing protein [Halobacillus sp. Nhm2S1]